MRFIHSRYYARQLQDRTTDLLLRRLQLPDYSSHCTATTLIRSLLLAAVAAVSIAAVVTLRSRRPSRETLRKAALATLPDYEHLQRLIPELLRADLPRRIRRLARRQRGSKKRRRFPIAIDLHGKVYYKRNQSPPEHARKGKRVGGTNYGHCYGTASLLLKGQYYIIALTPYQPREALVEVVKRLLRQTQKCGFSPKFVLCDRAFWSVAVFRYLKHAHYPFLTPVLSRGKKIDAPGGPTGTRIFFYDHPRGRYAYRMENRKRQGVWLTIVVSCHNRGGRKDQHGRYAWVYAIWGMAISTIQGVEECYRHRFRIESSYRLMEEARGRTSSRNEGLRLWYIVLAALMVNAWLALRWEISRQRLKGTHDWCWLNHMVKLCASLLAQETDDEPRGTPSMHVPLLQ